MTEKLGNPFKISELVDTVNEALDDLTDKQDVLVSGTNIKTVNGNSLLGSGDISVSADTSDCVKLTGNQTITGSKTFTSYQYIKNVDCSIANPPASTSWKYIDCIDSNSVRIGVIGSQINTNGTRGVYLQAGNEGNISIFTDGTTAYTSTVTPPASDNSTKIATTAWVKSQGYMSSGNIFPNNTWVSVGDDAYIGDRNQSGGVCIKGNNNSTGIYLYRRDETAVNGFYLDENDVNGLKIFSPTQGATAWGSVTAMMAQSLSGNGYVKFNHGLIIQWLYFAVSNNYVTVTFPTSFSNTNYAIVQTPISNNGTFPGGAWTGIRDKTTTNVKLGIRAGAGVGADTSYSHAIAIGY